MASLSINGVNYSGNSISIINGVVTIDGKVADGYKNPNATEIRVIEGSIGELITDLSVNCNNVTGNVKAGGSVNCDNVGGNVSSGGSVNCDKVNGSVTAGGSINHF